MQLVIPVHAIFRHAQDNGTSCGRACAQMVISSLTQGLPVATPIAVEQNVLQGREDDPADNTSTPSWFTHPDELLLLLRKATEFSAADAPSSWRIAKRASLKTLLADVVAAMQRGMPSILNVNESDHWVVLSGIGIDNGKLQFLKVLDPLPNGNGSGHTYVDPCSGSEDGSSYAQPWQVPTDQIGNLHMKVGSTPSPAGMKSYAGKFVAIVHGTATRAELNAAKQLIPPIPTSSSGNGGGGGAGGGAGATQRQGDVGDANALLAEFRACAERWDVKELRSLLAQVTEPVVRLVKNIDATNKTQYRLLSVFSKALHYGAVAAFPATSPTLMHSRIVNDDRIHASLRKFPAEPLWWHTQWMPSLNSPYFPFRQREVKQGVAEYERLFDGYPLKRPSPAAKI